MSDNPYDWEELDEIEQQKKRMASDAYERASAYHQVFAQNPQGQKILAEWVNLYCTSEPPSSSASEREVGMMDGKRQLIKLILDQITLASGERE